MMGRVASGFLLFTAIVGGLGVWWTQTRAYYGEEASLAEVTLTAQGVPRALPAEGTWIDADSSPLRYRACFDLEGPAPEADPYADAAPTVAPRWFECFDAALIGADLAAGRARAVMGTSEGALRHRPRARALPGRARFRVASDQPLRRRGLRRRRPAEGCDPLPADLLD